MWRWRILKLVPRLTSATTVGHEGQYIHVHQSKAEVLHDKSQQFLLTRPSTQLVDPRALHENISQ